jgi:hypothetical protein
MLTGEETERGSVDARPWAELLERHRADWVAEVAGERQALWLDDYTGERDEAALRTAAAEGRPLVLGLAADAGGAAAREASRLAKELGGVALTQRLAAGSLIGAGDENAGDVVHFLVCANVDAARAAESSTQADVEGAPLLSGYVRFLEQANRSLSEANARLARERLGVQDSAAAAVIAELQEQRRIAQENHESMLQARAALQAPRYRAVDRLREIVFAMPGLSTLFRVRSQRIQGRGSQR